MLLGLLTLITALSISAVAIYYSVAGLVAIFAAAALPIMIMGGVLEVGKLVTAVWLHRYWKQATWWLKSYLSVAVLVLMLITSMGIFGFLSKAHIEQTAASTESVARAEVLQKEIDRNLSIISRAENEIRKLESTGTGSDANIQAQIDAEQDRIDRAYDRIQPAIAEQQRIIDSQGQLFRDELARLDEKLATLQSYIDAGGRENIQRAQQMVGARADGAFGPNTAQAFRDWQTARQQERADLLAKIESASNNPQARAARSEIQRLRQGVEAQITESNRLINRLRQQIGSTDNSGQIQASIDEQNERIRTASSEIETLTQEKIQVESEFRKLEAEVGPIKYIAEFVYGETADTNMLEEAVRWVIIVIIFVFDPLAVLLLIASQYTFEFNRKPKDDNGERLRKEWREYEQTRAQAIIDNPGFTPSTSAPQTDPHPPGWMFNSEEKQSEDDRTEDPKETEQVDTSLPETQPSETVETQTEADSVVATEEETELEDEDFPEDDTAEERERRKVYEELESEDSVKQLKQNWKAENPNENLKIYKRLYIQGKIDNLPWLEGYEQNSEQNENSLWNKIQQNR